MISVAPLMQEEDSCPERNLIPFQKKHNCQNILDNLFNPDLALPRNTEESNKKLLDQKNKDQKHIDSNDSFIRFDSLRSYFRDTNEVSKITTQPSHKNG